MVITGREPGCSPTERGVAAIPVPAFLRSPSSDLRNPWGTPSSIPQLGLSSARPMITPSYTVRALSATATVCLAGKIRSARQTGETKIGTQFHHRWSAPPDIARTAVEVELHGAGRVVAPLLLLDPVALQQRERDRLADDRASMRS